MTMAVEDLERKAESYGGFAEEDDDDMQWSSRLIPAMVVLNVAVFFVVMYVNDCPKHTAAGINGDRRCVAKFLGRFSFQPTDENPLFGPSRATLKKTGALDWQSIVHKHQGWRLISCIWLHAGIIHLLTNMLSLVFVGIRLEQQFGFAKIGTIYLASGFGGSVLSSLLIQNRTSVGASGSLFGLLGAMLAELITNWTIYTNKGAALLTLSIIAAINLIIGVLPYVNNIAHIGGFLSGSLLGFVLLPRPRLGWETNKALPIVARLRSKYKARQIVLWATSLALLLAGFSVGLVMVFGGKNAYSRCSWCRYLSCVPTSRWKC